MLWHQEPGRAAALCDHLPVWERGERPRGKGRTWHVRPPNLGLLDVWEVLSFSARFTVPGGILTTGG